MPVLLLNLNPKRIGEERLRRIQALAEGYEVAARESLSSDDPLLPEIEISVGFAPPSALLESPPYGYKWHQQLMAGCDWLKQLGDPGSLPFVLTNVAGMHAPHMAEHAFAMIFGLARALPACIRAQSEKKWLRIGEEDLFDLAGKTLLVVGAGAIGQRVARLAQAHDMRVLGIRRRPEIPTPHIDEVRGAERLDPSLAEADVVVSVLPSTNATKGLFGKAQFAAMKPSAVFVNLGRGDAADEAALAEALRSGRLRGAGLDTFQTEPLPASSPLWELENCIVTPHHAGRVPGYLDRALDRFEENLKRYFAGQELLHIVDPAGGY